MGPAVTSSADPDFLVRPCGPHLCPILVLEMFFLIYEELVGPEVVLCSTTQQTVLEIGITQGKYLLLVDS